MVHSAAEAQPVAAKAAAEACPGEEMARARHRESQLAAGGVGGLRCLGVGSAAAAGLAAAAADMIAVAAGQDSSALGGSRREAVDSSWHREAARSIAVVPEIDLFKLERFPKARSR